MVWWFLRQRDQARARRDFADSSVKLGRDCQIKYWPLQVRGIKSSLTLFFRLCVAVLSDHRQERLSKHRQSNVPVPVGPAPYIVRIESRLVLGLLKTFFNCPA